MSGLRVGVGASDLEDTAAAIREASSDALRDVASPVLGLAFVTWQHDPATVAASLGAAFGAAPWAGCTSAGVFAGDRFLSRGVVVAVIDGAGSASGVGVASYARGERDAGAQAVVDALDGMPLTPPDRRRLVLLLADPAGVDVAEVVRGAVSEGGSGVIWAGGGAGVEIGRDGAALFSSAGGVHRGSVVAAALDVPRGIGSGVQHGWGAYGPPALVTRSSGLVAEELEYRGAFDVYREAARASGHGVDEASFPTFAMLHPLGIPQAGEEYLIRDPVAVLPSGGLRCMGELPDGALIRFMRAEPEAIVAAAARAAGVAHDGADGPLAGALVFDCVSRHLILGEGYERELRALRDGLGRGTPLVGCLSHGEVGSFGDRVPQFHNKTTVVVALPR